MKIPPFVSYYREEMTNLKVGIVELREMLLVAVGFLFA